MNSRRFCFPENQSACTLASDPFMKEKIWTKNFVFVFIAMFFIAMVMYMLMSTITEYATSYGATAGIAGLVSGIYVIGGLVARFYSGNALPRFGWKRMGLVSLAAHFFACFLYFVAKSLALLILVRFVHGLAFGAASSAILTIAMSILPKSRYGEAVGYFMTAPTLAIAVGPYAGGLVFDKFGASGCFVVAIIVALLMFLFIALIDIKDVDPGGRAIDARERASEARGLSKFVEFSAVPISFCIFLFVLGYSGVMSFIRLYGAQQRLSSYVSYFFIIYAAVLLVSRPFAGKLQDRLGDNIVVYPGIVAQAIGLGGLAWHPSPVSIVVAAVGCALGYGTLHSCTCAIACRRTTLDRRSYAVSTFWVFCDAGMGMGPTLLGMVAASGGYRAMYSVASTIAVVAIPIYFACWGRRDGKSTAAAAAL